MSIVIERSPLNKLISSCTTEQGICEVVSHHVSLHTGHPIRSAEIKNGVLTIVGIVKKSDDNRDLADETLLSINLMTGHSKDGRLMDVGLRVFDVMQMRHVMAKIHAQ